MNVTSEELQNKFADNLITLNEILSQANIYLAEDKLLQAYPYAKAAALLSQSSISDKMTAGILAVSLDKNEDALDMFGKILLLDPEHFDANYNIALLEVAQKKYTEASMRIKKLSENFPENSELLNDLAVIATYMHNPEKAFELWERALQINPNDSIARNNALAYSLEKHFYKEANQLLTVNEKSDKTNLKSTVEINRWNQIIDKKKNEIISTSNDTINAEIN